MTKLVMVETLSQFRHRYIVELPDNAENNWAVEDVIITGGVEEFSQTHLGELDFSSREITKEEYLRLFDEDVSYCRDWSEEQKLKFIHQSTALEGK